MSRLWLTDQSWRNRKVLFEFLGEGEVFSSRRRRAGKGRGNIISRTRHAKIGTRQQVFKWPSGPRLVCVASAGNAWVVALAAYDWLLAGG